MAREEIISSAVSFLRDPSVSAAPVEKKVAFLQSKNLTQEEIDISLSRVGEDASSTAATTSQNEGHSQQQQSGYRPSGPPMGQGYAYGPSGQWQQGPPPPPELPKRDWRDWFIMATVMGGVGYGLYFVAKRYITPLIAPPTPPQLQQDKEAIDEQFSRAFTLIDQLASDTAGLKAAEDARTERLDSALREVEDVAADMKSSSRRRDDETKRISDEVKSLKDGIPKAIDGAREGNEKRLKELGSELKSLKVLLGNRLGSSSASPAPAASSSPTAPRPATVEDAPSQSNVDVTSSDSQAPAANSTTDSPAPQSSTATAPPAREQSSGSSFSQVGKPAAIPAWQMAASNKSKPATESSSNDPAPDNSGSAEEQSSSAPPG